ncbi:5-amino-6-(5-phospho-D-ribitylamino)uracil phosphatase YigB [Orbaceae bacterium ac157xtp]
MQIYRPLNKIYAFTFDLDDTLYDNAPYITKSEQVHIETLQKVDGLQNVSKEDYKTVKNALLLENPEIYHDVVEWREQATKKLLVLHGLKDKNQIQSITDEAMQNFIVWRNKIIVPQESIDTLAYLAERVPLAVVTNGNADINLIGIGDYFQFALRGGPDGRSKPFPDLFNNATKRLNLQPENVMHVGDHLICDVEGAINAGMQACWLNVKENVKPNQEDIVLPHIQIATLPELNNLL